MRMFMDVFIHLIAAITPVLRALVGILKVDPQTCWHNFACNALDGMFNLNFLSPGGATVFVLITSHAPPLKWLIAIQWSASEIHGAAAATCSTLHCLNRSSMQTGKETGKQTGKHTRAT